MQTSKRADKQAFYVMYDHGLSSTYFYEPSTKFLNIGLMDIDKLEELITAGDLAGINNLLTAKPELAKSQTSLGVSPLMLSCYYKKPEISNLLLRFVDEINLFEACAVGKFDVVAYLINTHPGLIDDYAPDGLTPLGLACYFGQTEVARYLIMKGANVNQPSRNGYSVFPIHSAAAGNYIDIVRALLTNGADVNVKQQAGVTPLHSAAQTGNPDLLILLLEYGADVNFRMEGGKLPADLAREKGFHEIAEILS